MQFKALLEAIDLNEQLHERLYLVAGDRSAGAGRGGRGQRAAPLARGAGSAAPADRRLAQAQGVSPLYTPHLACLHTYPQLPSTDPHPHS